MNTPTEPTPPADPVNRASLRKRAYLLIPAIIILIIIGIVVGAVAFSGSDLKPQNNAQAEKQFTNYLKPTSEIKLGNYRYISPCQVFPLDEVSKIYGGPSDTTRVIEQYLDTSRAVTDDPLNTSYNSPDLTCGYELAKNNTVYLYTEQYSDPEQAVTIGKILISENTLNETIDALKTKAKGNKDAEALVKQMEKSRDGYLKYYKEYDRDILKKQNFDGYILPKYAASSLVMNYKNVTYNVEPRNVRKLTDASASDLAKYYKAFELIKKNASNKNLSQSPAPTILGDNDKIGSTKIVEACDILSKSVFKEITGQDDNQIIRRTSLPVEVNDDITSRTKGTNLYFNSCDRTYEMNDLQTSVSVTIRQAKSAAEAQEYVKNYDQTPEPPATPLQTSGDEAYSYPNPFNPSGGTPLYLVRTGPYVISITYNLQDSTAGLSGDIIQSEGSQEQVVKAMNILIDRIKN
jgi:hypothetical protein